VVRSNQIRPEEVFACEPSAVVLSPGPRGPDEAGCCLEVIRRAPAELPILGVCLGHQAIGAAFGGRIVRNAPRHGMDSPIEHDGRDLFERCDNPLRVARYHSLAVSGEGLPDCLQITATSQDDHCVMGLRHRERPIFGVQFHPESVLSDSGQHLIDNFARLATPIP
jgi:anthranilate synthase component 2